MKGLCRGGGFESCVLFLKGLSIARPMDRLAQFLFGDTTFSLDLVVQVWYVYPLKFGGFPVM